MNVTRENYPIKAVTLDGDSIVYVMKEMLESSMGRNTGVVIRHFK